MTDRTCAVNDCENPYRSKGYCSHHYERLRRAGSVRAEQAKRAVSRSLTGICTIERCGRPHAARGWCGMHYQRWLAHGDPMVTELTYDDDVARFWTKVDTNGPVPAHRPDLGPCWVWTAPPDEGGYGRFKADGAMRPAHRWAYSHFVAMVPDELEVDHLCRVRHCVNYERHLEPVTPLVNTQRSEGNGSKTRCKCGLPFDEDNTYYRPRGGRACRACTARWQREYYTRTTRLD